MELNKLLKEIVSESKLLRENKEEKKKILIIKK